MRRMPSSISEKAHSSTEPKAMGVKIIRPMRMKLIMQLIIAESSKFKALHCLCVNAKMRSCVLGSLGYSALMCLSVIGLRLIFLMRLRKTLDFCYIGFFHQLSFNLFTHIHVNAFTHELYFKWVSVLEHLVYGLRGWPGDILSPSSEPLLCLQSSRPL